MICLLILLLQPFWAPKMAVTCNIMGAPFFAGRYLLLWCWKTRITPIRTWAPWSWLLLWHPNTAPLKNAVTQWYTLNCFSWYFRAVFTLFHTVFEKMFVLRLCFLRQGEVKSYRWKPYVNRVSVDLTVAFSDFLLLRDLFPILPQMLFPYQR